MSTSVLHQPQRAQFSTAIEGQVELLHDARNIMSAFQLYCDLLAEPGVLAEGCQHFASEIRTLVATSSRFIERLASQDSNPQEICATPIEDLGSAVMQLKGPLAMMAGKKIEFEIECLPCPGRVALSQEDLARILMNLTRNAAEAMPQGGRIRVTVQRGGGGSFFDFLDEETVETRPTALLCVQDSGAGIPREALGRVFDAEFSTKRSRGNSGLGLHNVSRLVKASGGEVRAVSLPGHGARFEVELPLIGSKEANYGFPSYFPERANLEC